jgi:hypothetical protein
MELFIEITACPSKLLDSPLDKAKRPDVKPFPDEIDTIEETLLSGPELPAEISISPGENSPPAVEFDELVLIVIEPLPVADDETGPDAMITSPDAPESAVPLNIETDPPFPITA